MSVMETGVDLKVGCVYIMILMPRPLNIDLFFALVRENKILI